jgi:hypothetical protein
MGLGHLDSSRNRLDDHLLPKLLKSTDKAARDRVLVTFVEVVAAEIRVVLVALEYVVGND